MKQSKKYTLMFIILFFMIFYLSAKKVDTEQMSNLFNYDKDHYYSVNVNGDLKNVDRNKYFGVLVNNLKQYNLDYYSLLSDNDYESIVYAYSYDSDYYSKIILNQSEIDNLINFDPYATDAADDSRKIYTILDDSRFAIKKIDADDSTLQVNYGFDLVNENSSKDIDSFIQAMKTQFPTMNFTSAYIERHSNYKYKEPVENFVYLGLILIVFILNLDILSKYKKLSVLKLEGYNNFNLAYILSIKPYFSKLYIFILGNLLAKMLIRLPMSLWSVFDLKYVQLVIGISILYALCSLLTVLFIYEVPINSSLKGSNKISLSLRTLLLILLTTCFIGNSSLIQGMNSTVNLTQYIMNDAYYRDLYRYLYTPSRWVAGYKYPFGSEELASLKHELETQNGLFEYTTSDNDLGEDDYYIVDHNYLKQNNVDIDMDFNKKYIIIPPYCTQSEDSLVKIMRSMFFSDINIKVVYIDNEYLINYSSKYFLSDRYNNEKPLFVTQVGKDDYQINTMNFYYKGNLKEAQVYLDSLFDKHNLEHFLKVKSLEDVYINNTRYLVQEYKNNVILMCILLGIYCLLIIQIFEADYYKNRKRYKILAYEGHSYLQMKNCMQEIIMYMFMACLLNIIAKPEDVLYTIMIYMGLFILLGLIAVIKVRRRFK